MNGTETRPKFGTGAIIGCPLLSVKLELLRRGCLGCHIADWLALLKSSCKLQL